jgi:hypothetical protein
MSAPQSVAACHLELSQEERAELLRLLDEDLSDLHVEIRRTEAMDYRAQLTRQESILRGLAAKLRQARP